MCPQSFCLIKIGASAGATKHQIAQPADRFQPFKLGYAHIRIVQPVCKRLHKRISERRRVKSPIPEWRATRLPGWIHVHSNRGVRLVARVKDKTRITAEEQIPSSNVPTP